MSDDKWLESYDPKTGQWYVLPGWLDRDGPEESTILTTADIIEECGG